MILLQRSEIILLSTCFLLMGFCITACNSKLKVPASAKNGLKSKQEDSDEGAKVETSPPLNSKLKLSPGETLTRKYDELITSTEGDPHRIVEISTKSKFEKYLVATPRNYAVFVLFTRNNKNYLPGSKWDYAQRNFEWISRTYSNLVSSNSLEILDVDIANEEEDTITTGSYVSLGHLSSRIFFAKITMEKLSGVFNRLEIPYDEPALVYFPTKGKLSNLKVFDNSRQDLGDFHLVRQWVQKLANVKLEHKTIGTKNRYIDLTLRAIILLFFAYTCFRHWDFVTENVLDVKYISYVGLIAVEFCTFIRADLPLLFTRFTNFLLVGVSVILISGHVFNVIREPEFWGRTYIFVGRRYQFQFESIVMSVVYSGCSLGWIFMVEGRRKQLETKDGKSSMLMKVGCGISFVSFFTWRYVTHIKSGS